MRDNILLVEDEEALRMILGDRLQSAGYSVDYAVDGNEAVEKATLLPFDLILLDLMLPGRDGLTVCREIRDAGLGIPILMLTARTQTADKVAGLKIGADDYMTKPFDMQELMARVDALLRRAPIRQSNRGTVVQFDSVCVDVPGTEVTKDGKLVSLSAREFQLLRFLIERPGVAVDREELLRRVWGFDRTKFTRTVDVHVASLRKKLERDPKQPRYLVTVPGTGYKFRP
jgi:two-component system alkaline phosphatase synthesis response regulator PhoP